MSTMKELVRFKNEKEIAETTTGILGEVREVQIDSQPKYQHMAELAHWAKLLQKHIEEYFEPIITPAYQSWKAACSKRTEAMKPAQDAEALAKQRMRGWMEVQDRKAAEQTVKQAAKAEEKGITPPPPVANKAKIQGVVYQENYEVDLADLDSFLKAIIAKKLPDTMINIAYGEVKKYANATKGQVEIPGFKVTRRDIVKM